MTTFLFRFPGGQYHATPWGMHVNEAAVAWPPEPVRILRALVATWWRKLNHQDYPKADLDELIVQLASVPPEYHLPAAVHTHLRAFMPAPSAKKLIFDAFFRLGTEAELAVCWPGVTLSPSTARLAGALLENLGYLGRAESWVEARLQADWDGKTNARLLAPEIASDEGELVDVTIPLAASDWQALRGADPKRTRDLPAALSDALAVDTGVWQKGGWSSPPVMKRVVYERPKLTPPAARHALRARGRTCPGEPEVARFVIAARPLPRAEDGLRVAEILRSALMSDRAGKGSPVPVELSGRDEEGPLRRDAGHAHAFYLPEDADRDGRVDHVVVFARLGFSEEARRRLQHSTKLYTRSGEWRIALEGIARPQEFAGDSALLAVACDWESASPYLKPKFDRTRPRDWQEKVASYRRRIIEEWERRFPGTPAPEVEALGEGRFEALLGPGGARRSPLDFVRSRGGRGGAQPDTAGGFFRLRFTGAVQGPIALGWGAHFGLGLFRAVGGGPASRAGSGG